MTTLWHVLALATWGYLLYRLFCWLEARDRKAGETEVEGGAFTPDGVGCSVGSRASVSPASRIEVLQGQKIRVLHRGQFYECRDWADVMSVSDTLAELDRLPVAS